MKTCQDCYCGFSSILTPNFIAANIVLLEQGGIYAVANICGGGEYGEKWHRAGILEQKQNAIDDFIAALQEHNRGPNPVLIRIETSSSRGLDSLNKRLEAMADIWVFMFQNMGEL